MGTAVTAAVARVVAVAETAEAEKEGALVAFPQAAQTLVSEEGQWRSGEWSRDAWGTGGWGRNKDGTYKEWHSRYGGATKTRSWVAPRTVPQSERPFPPLSTAGPMGVSVLCDPEGVRPAGVSEAISHTEPQ